MLQNSCVICDDPAVFCVYNKTRPGELPIIHLQTNRFLPAVRIALALECAVSHTQYKNNNRRTVHLLNTHSQLLL